jgi:hypothetical protein
MCGVTVQGQRGVSGVSPIKANNAFTCLRGLQGLNIEFDIFCYVSIVLAESGQYQTLPKLPCSFSPTLLSRKSIAS